MSPIRITAPLLAMWSGTLFAQGVAPGITPTYVGSATCKGCHTGIYNRWTKTRMANVVVDPKVHPEAIAPPQFRPNIQSPIQLSDVALMYGSKWKQRYFQKVGDDYFPLGWQWDVINREWRRYNVAPNADWWTKFYPPENSARPTGPLCDGCHSVDYNIQTKQVKEWNVGCEKCHGPGSEHAANPSRASIVNPARLPNFKGNDVCIQCHSQGQPLSNPIQGKYYDWPVGFHVGLDLKNFWNLEEHKAGETTFTHFPDGTGHKNRMQGNDFVQSVMYTKGVTCFSCHDVHGTENRADLLRPTNVICLNCHGPQSVNGPHTATLEQHTHHKAGSPGSECVACHMPAIEQTIANINVRSHTFKFIPPSATETLKIPNPCNVCHTDKDTKWAIDTLKTWPEHSPWRVAQP